MYKPCKSWDRLPTNWCAGFISPTVSLLTLEKEDYYKIRIMYVPTFHFFWGKQQVCFGQVLSFGAFLGNAEGHFHGTHGPRLLEKALAQLRDLFAGEKTRLFTRV